MHLDERHFFVSKVIEFFTIDILCYGIDSIDNLFPVIYGEHESIFSRLAWTDNPISAEEKLVYGVVLDLGFGRGDRILPIQIFENGDEMPGGVTVGHDEIDGFFS